MLENIVSWIPKYVRATTLAVALPLISYAQTTITPTNTVSIINQPTGVAGVDLDLTVSSTNQNFLYNSSLVEQNNFPSNTPPNSYTNSNNVVDLGRTSDGQRTIELYTGGSFKIFNDADRTISFSGSIGSISNAWGISNTFHAESNQYVFIGYTDISSQNRIGVYNLTGNTFSSGFIFLAPTNPTGLGNYAFDGLTSFSNQRALPTFSNNTIIEFNTTGTTINNYNWDIAATRQLQITVTDSKIFGVFVDGTGGLIQSSDFNVSAIPEPSTYALFAGVGTLLVAMLRKRK